MTVPALIGSTVNSPMPSINLAARLGPDRQHRDFAFPRDLMKCSNTSDRLGAFRHFSLGFTS